jgi:hypothetical protein
MEKLSESTNNEEHFASLFNRVPQFLIDAKGTFKYIQVECRSSKLQKSVTFIRGRGGNITYHKEIFARLREEFIQAAIEVVEVKEDGEGTLWEFKIKLNDDLLTFTCPGGGRMVHDSAKKTLEVYGYSMTYAVKGKIKHDEAVRQAKHYLQYPDKDIKISNKKY